MFGARLGTASRRIQSSRNSASVGSSGSSSGSASRARHASTNSRTPGQPPISLASSKSRSQRRALSMRWNVARPARSSPSSSGFQRKRTTCGGPGSPASVRVEWIEATSLPPYPGTGGRPYPSSRDGGRLTPPSVRPATSAAARRRARGPPTRSRSARASARRAACGRAGAAKRCLAAVPWPRGEASAPRVARSPSA